MAAAKRTASLKHKTTAAGIASIIGAAAAYYTGTLPVADAIQLATTGLLAIFLRQGIDKGPTPEK